MPWATMPPMPSYTIREGAVEDAERLIERIIELARYERLDHTLEISVEELKRWIFSESPVAGSLVAESNGDIVGYAIYFRSFSTFVGKPGFWLEDLYVTPEMRGKGIGRALLRRLAEETVSCGFGRLEWSVLDWNQPSIEFYEAIGADILGDWRICRLAGEKLLRFVGT